MGASLALAGASGCIRMPEEKLVPYAHRPPSRTPGEPVRYATAMEIGGIAQGLLVTSYDGRPVKIEGNPSHPLNRGACDAIAQASILELYDPDRSRGVIRRNADGTREASSWEEFARWAKGVFKGDGKGICVLSEASNSPSLAHMRERFKKALPKSTWYEYEHMVEAELCLGGTRSLKDGLWTYHGPSCHELDILDLTRAKVIVSLDADLFGGGDPMAIKYARDFAAGRRLHGAGHGEMNRLYVIESVPTITGACADHRQAIRPSSIAPFLMQLRQALAPPARHPKKFDSGIDEAFVEQLAADLKANVGRSVIVVGKRLDPTSRNFAADLNAELGSFGRSVVNYAPAHSEVADQMDLSGMRFYSAWRGDGSFDTLLILGGNLAYDAPSDAYFAKLLKNAKNTIHLAIHDNETSRLCDWHLSRAHYLESWGDARTFDGTVSIVQPLIEPLFDGRSAVEVLAMILGDKDDVDSGGREIVRRTFRSLTGKPFSEWKWKKSLADGVIEGSAWPVEKVEGGTAGQFPSMEGENWALLDASELEVVFFTDAKVYDGRFANNGWLQEMPDPMTRVTWGNAALMNEKTAVKIGVKRDEIVALKVEESPEVEFPVLFQPGMPDGVIAVALGYGRTAAGNIGNGVGGNAYLLRDSKSIERGWAVVTARPTGKTHVLATVQDHHIIDTVGKEAVQERIPELIHEGTLAEYRKDPSLGHKNVFGTRRVPAPSAPHTACAEYNEGTPPANVPTHDFHRWGMAVDLTTCTGCGACVIACQAENNIPIVGREQVLLGREMHWIRVDRYFRRTDIPVCQQTEHQGRVGQAERSSTDGSENVGGTALRLSHPTSETDKNVCPPGRSVHQPVLCMQCENAPCEEVCPFGATTHSLEGLNMMTYNRCGGTRYCSNNCPYKVRRFNYFDFNCGTLKDLYTPNLVREPISELLRMQKNPDVTVRMRGVMEKCTYCIQRIEHARIAAKRDADRPLRDGEIQTACQQTCPAGAIVFGDLNDPNSRVSKLYALARSYGLLNPELNTKPRTRYLARVRNPAPGLDPV
jgi:molybdopterin-containing oxidoreductase family iron-sulfur binding subunit